MKNVVIRCCKCSKEIFSEMYEYRQKSMTVYEANKALCSDCHLKMLELERKEEDS